MESFRSLTVTQRDQIMVEQQVFSILKTFYEMPPSSQSVMMELQREDHVEYLTKGLKHLGPNFCVASLLNILDDDLVQGLGDYILSCQTYEGGIAGEPGSEAHGGIGWFSDKEWRVDFRAELINWLMVVTPSGRVHSTKVEQSASLPGEEDSGGESLQTTTSSDEGEEDLNEDSSQAVSHFEQGDTSHQVNVDHHKSSRRHARVEPLFNSLALQQYIILCAQEPGGGLRDKPGKSRDHYHTCYCLSGLSPRILSTTGNISISTFSTQLQVTATGCGSFHGGVLI
ncbi:Prenyltransferase/squalene oxidase [Corchorus olitorius]|uniref:Prenyltransferase/squalene oxidase n=1 Tax=Corchorus olitorius TaxID=93759 RepID=A0A1R3HHH0_9ROSI|nr:Prenyltransferase/squalene oxidase [Corchorus olitorius]